MEHKIRKNGGMAASGEAHAEYLALINAYTRRELSAEEVYVFAVRLCDNEIDRDYERFSDETLEALAVLMVGKSGISDHSWSSDNQRARIFKTRVEENSARRTSWGGSYRELKAWAYCLSSEENGEMIRAIDGGIKKEVSIGCSVRAKKCSICGSEGPCAHEKGRSYDGVVCHAILSGAADAYEWSFVAVPAQRGAGVVKGFAKGGEEILRDYLQKGLEALPAEEAKRAEKELKRLECEAEAGRRYVKALRADICRMGAVCDLETPPELMRTITERLSTEELEALCKAYSAKVSRETPPEPQLKLAENAAFADRDGEYAI